jgi:hypothetical protein
MSRETTQSRYKFTCDYCAQSTHDTFTDGGHSSPSDLPQGWLCVLRDGRPGLNFCGDRCAAAACRGRKHRLTREDPAVRG